VLAEDELEDNHADAKRRQERDGHRGNEIKRRDDCPQEHDQDQQHDKNRHGEDELHVVVVVVADIRVHRGQPGDRNLRVGQFRVGLRAASRIHDLSDLVHRLRPERIEIGLHQIPHRVAVCRDEHGCRGLEFTVGQNLGRNVEAGHRRFAGVVAHGHQKR